MNGEGWMDGQINKNFILRAATSAAAAAAMFVDYIRFSPLLECNLANSISQR